MSLIPFSLFITLHWHWKDNPNGKKSRELGLAGWLAGWLVRPVAVLWTQSKSLKLKQHTHTHTLTGGRDNKNNKNSVASAAASNGYCIMCTTVCVWISCVCVPGNPRTTSWRSSTTLSCCCCCLPALLPNEIYAACNLTFLIILKLQIYILLLCVCARCCCSLINSKVNRLEGGSNVANTIYCPKAAGSAFHFNFPVWLK